MTSKKDLYDILGVSRDAADAELKKAYRRLAMKHHPDRNKGDKDSENKFKDVKNAYDILSDPSKRSAYDQFGHEGVDPSAQSGGGYNGGFGGDPFSDIFGDIFGGGWNNSDQGSDLVQNVSISLEDAVVGTETEVNIDKFLPCSNCDGNGCQKGHGPVTCSNCNGRGKVFSAQSSIFLHGGTCRACRGKGKVIKKPCHTCSGEGRIKKRKILSVKLPSGIDAGDRIRLKGEGDYGIDGSFGDLYVQVDVLKHSIFKRQEDNLFIELPISFTTAVLGGELLVPTFNTEVKLTIPSGTQTGQMFRIKGRGVKSLKAIRSSVFGDLYCKVIIETPVNLTDEQKNTIKGFEKSLELNQKQHKPKSHKWFDSIKNFFKK